jgi:hypothetical protein
MSSQRYDITGDEGLIDSIEHRKTSNNKIHGGQINHHSVRNPQQQIKKDTRDRQDTVSPSQLYWSTLAILRVVVVVVVVVVSNKIVGMESCVK